MVNFKNYVKTFIYNGAHRPPASKSPGLLLHPKYVLAESLSMMLGICILNPADESNTRLWLRTTDRVYSIFLSNPFFQLKAQSYVEKTKTKSLNPEILSTKMVKIKTL